MSIINNINIIKFGQNLSINWASEILKHRGALVYHEHFDFKNTQDQILVVLTDYKSRQMSLDFCKKIKTQAKWSLFRFQVTDSQSKGINLAAQSTALISMGQDPHKPFYPNFLAETVGSIGLANFVLFRLFENIKQKPVEKVYLNFEISIKELLRYHASFNVSAVKNNLIFKQTGQNILDGGAPFYRIYKCANNTNIAVGNLQSKFYNEMVLGLKSYLSEKQFELLMENQINQQIWPQIKTILTKTFLQKQAKYWEEALSTYDTCVTEIKTHSKTDFTSDIVHPNLLNKQQIPKL